MRINPPLVALAIGAFGIGVTEFAPMGMLPGSLRISAFPFPPQVCWSVLTPWAYCSARR